MMEQSPGLSRRTLSRRQVLAGGAWLSALLVAACSQQAAPSPTTAPAAQATAAPTQAPAQAAAPTATTAPAAQAAASTATAVPAAQSAPAASGSKTLKFSSYSFSTFEDAMKQMFKNWDPTVNVQSEFAGGNDYWNKVQVEIASGQTPDLGIGEFNLIVSFANNGAVLALDDLIKVDKFSFDPFFPSAIDQYRWKKGDFDSGSAGGSMYGLPGDAQPYLFAYNKSMFDEAKVDYPTDSWTWDDVVAAGKKMTQASNNKWGCYAPGLGQFNEGEWVYSAGGKLLSADYKKSALDTPETMSAYKWAWDLIYTHKIAPKPVPNEAVDPFQSGRVAMFWDGIWRVADFAKINQFQWDLAPHPKNPKTGKRVMTLQSDGWWIYSAAKEKDLAWNLMKFLVGNKGQQEFADLDYFIPASIPEIAQNWFGQKPPDHRSAPLKAVQAESAKVADSFFDSSKVQGAYVPILQKAWFDGADIESTLKQAAQAMTDQISQSWQSFQQ